MKMATYRVINYIPPSTVYKEKEYDETQGAYASQIANAQRLLDQQIKNKPGVYQSSYQNDITGTINQIKDRKPFAYDLNADALYNQYKDQYVSLGKQAMADTIGQATALTGGYGNSYAATAGNQAYQNYLSQLNNVVPELYNNAYGRYKDEEQTLYNMLSMYQNQDALDYGKYQDTYSNWQNDRNFYAGELSTLRGLNQDAWAQNESNRYNANSLDWNNYYNAESYNLDSYKQAVAEDQFNAQLAEQQRQYNNEQALQYDKLRADSSNNSANSQSINITQYANDNAVKSFKASVLTSQEFSRRAQNNGSSSGSYNGYDSYQEYIEGMLDKNKSLSNNQKLYLMDYYGL